MGASPLRLDPVGAEAAEIVLPLVRGYFAYDGLVYDGKVEAAVRELLGDERLGQAFLARVGERVVGYCVLTYGYDAEAGGRIGVATDVFLVEAARGRGLGRALMGLLVAFAAGAGLNRIELVVLDGNEAGRGLYASVGFTPVVGRSVMSLGTPTGTPIGTERGASP